MPLLSREREAALARLVRAGDRVALDELVRANLRFVVAVAKQYHCRDVPLGDLIAEGNLGLLRAAQKFDPAQGARFVTYAVYWIRQALAGAIAEHAHIVRVPRDATAAARESGATTDAIMAGDSQRQWRAERARIAMRRTLSLDTPIDADADTPLGNLIADERGHAADALADSTAIRSAIARALRSLSERDAIIIRLRFGLDEEGPFTIDEIAVRLRLSPSQVRQRLGLAIDRLRQGESGRVLATFAA